ncbi:uncharacterized protein HMPREF1541_06275 [Cyphellophora europaea CBS 101466]|uniref:AB hydrolase-1 domain-containing protein n=1 Tax=Cyphellophora europaea (strain CBS 101466) TaxID=1220924 RepID=W2RR85_CYPE1|nr:uncharacterized protein HMPREF1541_06275 [Cyphellophora europaea CBS 101466]ETN38244.1 hypothetical protein HMPREF1541_06275 [Cyphellophora europaea CBS 101466]
MAELDVSKLAQKTLDVTGGLTYTYYTSPAQGSKPTLILFHGWPDTARLWAGFINNYLLPNGYGVIALDCLGYGGTSKPLDLKAYAYSNMTAHAVAIMDAEKVNKVVSVGHDWGSVLCQRLYNYYPERVSGVIMINVTYFPPGGQFDLDAVNKATKEAFGHGVFEYWHFFTADDGAKISNENLESVYTVAHGKPETWLDNWTTPGGMRKYVSEGRTQPVLPYATGAHKADFMDRFRKDGLDAPSCWYKASTFGIQSQDEQQIREDAKQVNVPTLYWGGEQDYVCLPAGLQASVDAGFLPHVKAVTRQGGHWALLAGPEQFGQDLLSWLQETYA